MMMMTLILIPMLLYSVASQDSEATIRRCNQAMHHSGGCERNATWRENKSGNQDNGVIDDWLVEHEPIDNHSLRRILFRLFMSYATHPSYYFPVIGGESEESEHVYRHAP